MSDLQRKWAKTKAHAMAEFDEADEDKAVAAVSANHVAELPEVADDDSSSASSMSSTGTVVPSPSRSLFARPQGYDTRFVSIRATVHSLLTSPVHSSSVVPGRGLEPVPWTTYLERELYLTPEDNANMTYHAYLTSPVARGPLFVTHHGAGSSGLSFAVLSAELRKRIPGAGILSPDARGHGSTTVAAATASSSPDLSLATLAADLLAVITLTQRRMKWAALPPIVLVGHSLGGAVVTEVARGGRLGAALLGYAVLDVVEGSAVEALQSMSQYLATRPSGFASLREGIAWHVRSRTIRNAVSARTSVPALLVASGAGGGAGGEEEEEEEGSGRLVALSAASTRRPWRWRTDLAATQPFWEGWFVGLSKKFLEAKGGKLLLLAGTDRLDTELTIGQMQGKHPGARGPVRPQRHGETPD